MIYRWVLADTVTYLKLDGKFSTHAQKPVSGGRARSGPQRYGACLIRNVEGGR